MQYVNNDNSSAIHITGIGVISAIGQGKESFCSALLEGHHAFGIMQRAGRQHESSFIGAEIASLSFPEEISKKTIRSTSFSEQSALATLSEAWHESELYRVDPERVGLVVGGSNFHQRHIWNIHEEYRERESYINPGYGFTFLDSDLCGVCTEQFGIKGLAYPVGGASAGGQLAVIQAVQAVLSGQVDVCLALGGMMDLSFWEFQALRSLGAMGSDRYASEPALACRPFDKNHDGFISGEACGVVVIERASHARQRQVKSYAAITGWGLGLDANRNPNPSYEGECKVIGKALQQAGLSARQIDYINPHGTASLIGDETELRALHDSGLGHAFINATKSITGHGLSAAGTVEVIATLLQMQSGKLHPTRNLEEPIDPGFRWVQQEPVIHNIKHALSLSMGFGGINTALCLQNLA